MFISIYGPKTLAIRPFFANCLVVWVGLTAFQILACSSGFRPIRFVYLGSISGAICYKSRYTLWPMNLSLVYAACVSFADGLNHSPHPSVLLWRSFKMLPIAFGLKWLRFECLSKLRIYDKSTFSSCSTVCIPVHLTLVILYMWLKYFF